MCPPNPQQFLPSNWEFVSQKALTSYLFELEYVIEKSRKSVGGCKLIKKPRPYVKSCMRKKNQRKNEQKWKTTKHCIVYNKHIHNSSLPFQRYHCRGFETYQRIEKFANNFIFFNMKWKVASRACHIPEVRY